jgi:Arc/MetJ family transcription regulator
MPPELSRIAVEETDFSVCVVLHPTPSVEGWLFAVLLLGTDAMTIGMVPEMVRKNLRSPGGLGFVFAALFFVMFVLVVTTGLVQVLRAMLAREEISVDARRLTISSHVLGLSRRRSFPMDRLRGIRWRNLSPYSSRRSARLLFIDVDGEVVKTHRHLSWPEANHVEKALRRGVERLQRSAAEAAERGVLFAEHPFRSPSRADGLDNHEPHGS